MSRESGIPMDVVDFFSASASACEQSLLHPRPIWARLGFSEEEWRDLTQCERCEARGLRASCCECPRL